MAEVHRSPSTTTSLASDFPRPESGAISLARVSSLPGDDVTAWLLEKFPSLPADDVVDVSYSCALVKGILLQGRLYVTKSSLLFYAKIFGRVTKEYVPLALVRSVRKRRSGFVANAIKVSFMDPSTPPLVFGSLNRRERACALITTRLLAVNPAAEVLREGEDEYSAEEAESIAHPPLSSGSGGSDDHFRSRSVPSATAGMASIVPRAASEFGVHTDGEEPSSLNGTDFARANTDGGYSGGRNSHLLVDSRIGRRYGSTASEGVVGAKDTPLYSSPDSCPLPRVRQRLWKVDDDVTDSFSGKEQAKRKEQARRVFDAPVQVVFDLLFSGDFITTVHEQNGNTGCTETHWARGDDGYMTRTLCFSRALGYRIGPKATRVVETHRYSFTSDGGALVEFSGHNLDVPMGDSFRVESYFELKPEGSDGASTLVIASVAVHFTKSTMLRNKIESGALTETQGTMTRFLDLAELCVTENMTAEGPTESVRGNERLDSSLNKRPSESLLLTAVEVEHASNADPLSSPTKRMRSDGSRASWLFHASHPGTNGSTNVSTDTGLGQARAGGRGGASTKAETVTRDLVPSPVGQAGTFLGSVVDIDFGMANRLRWVTVALLAIISFLMILCILMLVQLRRDVHRLEHLALALQGGHATADLANICSKAGVLKQKYL